MCLICFFSYVSKWGKSHPYQIFRIPYLFICIEHPLFGTQKSCVNQEEEEPRQTDWDCTGSWGNSKEERVLCCVLIWLWGSKCWFILWNLDRNCTYVSQKSLEYLGSTCGLIFFFICAGFKSSSCTRIADLLLWLKSWGDFWCGDQSPRFN